MTKPKLLWISDSPRILQVGQSVVARNILSRLKEEFEIEALGYGNANIPKEETVDVDYKVNHFDRGDMNDVDKVVYAIEQSRADVIVFSHDPWLFPTIGYTKAKLPHKKFIGYLTVDGEPAYIRWRTMIKPYDKVITPTHFSKDTLLDRWMDLDIDVIPFGVDHSIYHPPKQGKDQLKAQLTASFRNLSFVNLNNKFMGIYVGANQDRKNLALTHEAWKIFEKGKEHSVVFYLFTHSVSLKDQMGSYDLGTFLDCTTFKIVSYPVPLEHVSKFVVASDVLLHPSMGECPGLTLMESLASGTVPITTNYAGQTDFCNKDNCYEIDHLLHTGGYHVHRAVGSLDSMVDCLERAYSDREELARKSENAVKSMEPYTWDNCANKWKDTLHEVLNRNATTLYVKQIV